MRSVIYTALFLFAGGLVAADDFAVKFEGATAKRCSPGLELDFDSLPSETDALSEKLTDLTKAGFSSILLKAIPPETNSWQKIAAIASQCHRRSMKLGCAFFPSGALAEGRNALLNQLGWSCRDYDKNRSPDYGPHRRDLDPVAGVLVPAVTNADRMAGSVVIGVDALPQQGHWHEFQFFTEPVQPHRINYLNQELFIAAVNQLLLEAQQQLDLHYGTVLDWIWFSSLPNTSLVWSEGLERWFNERAALDLIPYLPVLAGAEVKSAEYDQSVRCRYQQGIKTLWRDQFARNVETLIPPAGLHAGIRIDEIPLDPETVGVYFGVTLLNAGTNKHARLRNRRAAGGARVSEGKSVVGRIDSCGSRNLKSTVDCMFIEGADSTLFDASILDFKGDSGFGKINELMDYIRRIQFVLQNSKAESQFLLCSSSIPESLNQYTFDSVNPEMLQRAEIIENDLVFASDRRYATVVFSDEMLRSGPGKEIALALKAKGVRVSGLTGEPGDDAEAHNKLHESLNINALGAIRNLPELLPALTWRSDQGQIDIRFMHRSDAARDFYLIKNESDAAGMVTLTFTASEYSGISRWQPLDGKIYEINQFTRPDKLHTSIPTLVRPGELFFMVFSRP